MFDRTRERMLRGTRSSLEEVRRGSIGSRRSRQLACRLHRLHLRQQDRARVRCGRHCRWPRTPATIRWPIASPPARPLGPGSKLWALCPGQGGHPRARGGRADLRGHEHLGRAHRLAAPRHQAEPAVREPTASRFWTLTITEASRTTSGSALPLGAARRGGDHRRRA